MMSGIPSSTGKRLRTARFSPPPSPLPRAPPSFSPSSINTRAASNMADSEVSSQMREDWNARAKEDAGYYVSFGRRDSDDALFFATATEVIHGGLECELLRVPLEQRGDWRALEIGCGPGRLMPPMSRHFVEIHGVDVSDEMITLAKQKLADVPNAFPHMADGSSLAQFPDESFEFVYSYAV